MSSSKRGLGHRSDISQPVGPSTEQLRARLYDTSELLSGGQSSRPQLKMIKKRNKTTHAQVRCLIRFMQDFFNAVIEISVQYSAHL